MRIGIFGGTFDPPHVGHLMVAQDAVEELGLDRLYWVPARQSPFKEEGAGSPAELRARLVERSIRGHPVFQLWRGELDRPAPSWTVDTVETFRATFPAAELHLLMGTDQWASFDDWKDPDRIRAMATICILGRGDGDGVGKPGPGVRHLSTRRVELSATEVRDRVRQGRSIRYLVTDAVLQDIELNELYRMPADAGTRAGSS